MTGPAISNDKVRQLPWEANTSIDSVIVLTAVGASTSGQYGVYKCLMSLKKKSSWHFSVSKSAGWTNCGCCSSIIDAPRLHCWGVLSGSGSYLWGFCYSLFSTWWFEVWWVLRVRERHQLGSKSCNIILFISWMKVWFHGQSVCHEVLDFTARRGVNPGSKESNSCPVQFFVRQEGADK